MRSALSICTRIALLFALAACCKAPPPPVSYGQLPYGGYGPGPHVPGYAPPPPAPRAPLPPGYEVYREPEAAPQAAPYQASPYYSQSPYAASPLYRATKPGSALATPCEEGCNGHRCDATTGRCIFPCRSNADCETGYSCELNNRNAAICIWP